MPMLVELRAANCASTSDPPAFCWAANVGLGSRLCESDFRTHEVPPKFDHITLTRGAGALAVATKKLRPLPSRKQGSALSAMGASAWSSLSR